MEPAEADTKLADVRWGGCGEREAHDTQLWRKQLRRKPLWRKFSPQVLGARYFLHSCELKSGSGLGTRSASHASKCVKSDPILNMH